jgi:hypothetical protein
MNETLQNTPAAPEPLPAADQLAGPLQALVASGKLGSLELDKKRLLAAFLEYGFTTEAHNACSISSARHYRWLRTDEVYAEACKALGEGLLLETAHRLDNLLPKATEALEDALDAEKMAKVVVDIDVECPECGHFHTVSKEVRVPIADLKLRVDVAKSVLNRRGEMGVNRVKVEGKVEHEHGARPLTLEERQYLQMIERGLAVPAHIRARLSERGLLQGVPQGDSYSEDRYSQSAPGEEAPAVQYRVLEESGSPQGYPSQP